NPRDIPFALIYALDEDKRTAILAGRRGIEASHKAAPETISLDDDVSWPIAQCVKQGVPVLLPDLQARFGELPCGAWDTQPVKAAILPIAALAHGGAS